MNRNFIFLFLLVCSTSFCQTDNQIKISSETQTQVSENSLTKYTDDLIKRITNLKNAEIVKIIVNDAEVKSTDNFNFDIVDLRELIIVRNENIEKDENRTSYSIIIKTVKK